MLVNMLSSRHQIISVNQTHPNKITGNSQGLKLVKVRCRSVIFNLFHSANEFATQGKLNNPLQ